MRNREGDGDQERNVVAGKESDILSGSKNIEQKRNIHEKEERR